MGSVRPSKKTASNSKSSSKLKSKPSTTVSTKPKGKKPGPKPKPTEQKTKRPTLNKKRLPASQRYDISQLNVPTLNGIIPANAKSASGGKPKGGLGKVKNKVFVDDSAHMLAILGAVQAEKEGEREGKIMQARRLEELREEKRMETERRAEGKRKELEGVMDELKKEKSLKKNRRGKHGNVNGGGKENEEEAGLGERKKRGKKVTFG